MIIRYDKRARAISIQLMPSNPSEYSHTEEITDLVFIDRDKNGNATSVEVLGIECIEDYGGNEYKLGEKTL